MKSATIFLTIIFSIFTVQPIFGQININIPWGKKKTEGKKEEPKKNEVPREPISPEKSEAKKTSDSPKNQNSPLGTIYFSNKPFPTDGSVNETKTSFNSKEFVYGRIILKGGNVRDVLKPFPPKDKTTDYFVPLLIRYFEGVTNMSAATNIVVSEADFDKTYLDFDIILDPKVAKTLRTPGYCYNCDYSTGLISKIYHFLVTKAEEKTHLIKIEIKIATKDFRGNPIPGREWETANADLNYTFSGADFNSIKSNYELLEKKDEMITMQNVQLPAAWSQPSSSFAFGETKAKLLSMFLNISGSKTQVIKFHAYPPRSTVKWNVSTNAIGIPLVRYHNQIYSVFYKDANDSQCYARDLRLYQRYAGGGKYSPTVMERDVSIQIMCSKLGLK